MGFETGEGFEVGAIGVFSDPPLINSGSNVLQPENSSMMSKIEKK